MAHHHQRRMGLFQDLLHLLKMFSLVFLSFLWFFFLKFFWLLLPCFFYSFLHFLCLSLMCYLRRLLYFLPEINLLEVHYNQLFLYLLSFTKYVFFIFSYFCIFEGLFQLLFQRFFQRLHPFCLLPYLNFCSFSFFCQPPLFL